ncbi:hypothetical protein EDC04DRAFT_2590569, partial [Pisolithus marmoratus]
SEVKKCLPTPLFYAGKLQVHGGGDSFWMTAITSRAATPQRKNCYIKYEVTFENHKHSLICVTGYGDLNKIFMLTLASDAFFTSLSSKMLILALITPWNTEGKDAMLENTYLLSWCAPIITDV